MKDHPDCAELNATLPVSGLTCSVQVRACALFKSAGPSRDNTVLPTDRCFMNGSVRRCARCSSSNIRYQLPDTDCGNHSRARPYLLGGFSTVFDYEGIDLFDCMPQFVIGVIGGKFELRNEPVHLKKQAQRNEMTKDTLHRA